MVIIVRGRFGEALFVAASTLLFASLPFVTRDPAPFDVLFVFWVIIGFTMRRFQIKHTLPIWIVASVGVYLVATALSIATATDFWDALRYALITSYLVSLGFLTASCRMSAAEWKIAISALLVGTAASLTLSIPGWMGLFIQSEAVPRFQAHFKDPNVLGAFLVFVAAISVGRAVTEQNALLRWIYRLVALGFAGALLVTWSRGALLGLAVASLAYASFHIYYRGGAQSLLLSAGVLIFLTAAASDFVTEFLPRLPVLERFGLLYTYDLFHRLPMMVYSLHLMPSSPWGIGPGAFERDFAYASHNLYLRVLVENGWAAGAAFLAIVFGTITALIRGAARQVSLPGVPSAAVLTAVLAGIVVHSMVIDSLHWRHFWVCMGWSWATIQVSTHTDT